MAITVADVEMARALFEDAVARARVAGSVEPRVEQLIADTIKRFDEIKTEVTKSPSGASTLEDELEMLAQRRAYIIPEREIPVEGMAKIAELREWRVPDNVLSELQSYVTSSKDIGAARAALLKIYEAYAYWDSYVSWFFSQQKIIMIALLVVSCAGLGMGLTALHSGSVLFGFIFAGVCGASVSIALKLPPLSVYGEVAPLLTRIGARLCAGIAASAIGCGLLASGIINVGFSGTEPLSVPIMMVRVMASAEAQKPLGATMPIQNVDTTEQLPDTANAGMTGTEGDPENSKTIVASSPATRAKGVVPCSGEVHRPTPEEVGMTNRLIAILLAIGMLLGFSERALSSFEELVTLRNPAAGPAPKDGPAKS